MVHNGIIENHAELRAELEAAGQCFDTDTDTRDRGSAGRPQPEARHVAARGRQHLPCPRLHGAYALAMIFAGHPELMIGARHGAPLAIGYGEDEMFLGSDSLALAPLTRRIAYLRDGEWAVLSRAAAPRCSTPPAARCRSRSPPARCPAMRSARTATATTWEKELREHPLVIVPDAAAHDRPRHSAAWCCCRRWPFDLARIPRITVSPACGSAFYAGLIGRWWLESEARIPVDADVASELRYTRAAAGRGAGSGC